MRTWTLRLRIAASFGFLLALIALLGGLTHWHLLQVSAETAKVEKDSIAGLRQGAALRARWREEQVLSLQMRVAKSGEERRNLQERLSALRQERQQVSEAYAKTITLEEDRRVFAAVQDTGQKVQELNNTLSKLLTDKAGDAAVAAIVTEQEHAQNALYQQLKALLDLNDREAKRSMGQIREQVANTQQEIGMVALISAGAALLMGWWLLSAISRPMQEVLLALDAIRQGDFSQRLAANRSDEFGTLAKGFNRMSDELAALVGQIQQSSMHVGSSIVEIAATTRQQQATAVEVAATTSEIAATSNQIANTAHGLLQTVKELAHAAEQSAALAGGGHASLARMEASMHGVMNATEAINARLTVLNERAANIGMVVTTITKVADQTNLLSLNAAIEAEKAGEFGRGFAVVATEVRRLADQSAIASEDIEQMVKEIQSAVSASVMGMDKFADEVRRGTQEAAHVSAQLGEIIQQAQALAPRFDSVNNGMQTQTDGAGQISQALTQLGEAARQTVQALSQSEQAIQSLDGVAQGLRNGVSRFKLHA
ncbi:methyl-accepting chemotaxis protein [Paucibacter soli]|uniref:methyl-accepting chemotaxis protein n=1 Tax=Paucibacter soli TaxID=3133433 RepID=UPI0030A27DF2